MINTLHIKRFKSIKELSLNCKKINVFIGQPNSGKSNILETIGMFSFLHYSRFGYDARSFVRFERTGNLFYDEIIEEASSIKADSVTLEISYSEGRFHGNCTNAGASFRGDHTNITVRQYANELLIPFKSYRFSVKQTFTKLESQFLLPPSGDNLLSLLLVNKELRSLVNQPFSAIGLRLGLRPQESKIEVVKQLEDLIVSYPYSLVSETLQRLTFYLAAILSNKRSVIAFEEPESHAFPYYTKQLAELIALDQNENQYFISTHNPYFLLPLLAKAPKGDVAVNITYFEDYETKVRVLTEKELAELAEIDVFSNLDRYLQAK